MTPPMPSGPSAWSPKKVNLVTGFAWFAGLAALMGVVHLIAERRLWLIGNAAGVARWTPVVAGLWAASFLRQSPTTLGGFRRRSSLPLWLVAPWVPLAFGPVEWAGALLYYLPMLAGLVAMSRAEGKADDARAASMPGVTWSEAGSDITVSIPNGAEARRLLQAAGREGVLLRGGEGPGSVLELLPGAPLGAFVESPARLTVICPPDSAHLAFWGNEPVTWILKRGVGG